jgi:hypothetical protein
MVSPEAAAAVRQAGEDEPALHRAEVGGLRHAIGLGA